MSEHTIKVDVVVVTNQVDLEEETLYLYRDGQLLTCGAVACVVGHLKEGQPALALEHFDETWKYPGAPAHVVRGGS